MSFVHLHTHSEYSLLDGAQGLGAIVTRAAEWQMPAVALTDHGNMFGAVLFSEKCKAAGVKAILGCEIYVAPTSRHDKTRKAGGTGGSGEAYEHMVLLAETQQGYSNLMALVSKGYLEGFYYKPRVDDELLAHHSKGLIALSGCPSGRVGLAIRQGRLDDATAAAMKYADIFGPGRFYLEMQDHGMEMERDIVRGCLEIAKKTGLPLVATNDSHYLEREHAEAHDALLCIGTGKMVSDHDRLRFDSPETFFKSAVEMETLFAERPDAIANTLTIAEMCHAKIPMGQMLLPEFPIPPEYEDAGSYLSVLSRAGLKQRYPATTPEFQAELDARLQFELDTIIQMGFPGYFLITRDFTSKARELGVQVGPGRGSAAGSLVSYALEITDIDPIRFGLIFERFLNPERVTMPDIDIDFDDRGRGKVIEYVIDKYGAGNVTQIITFGTLAARAAVRDVARVLGLPFSEVDKIAKLVPAELGMTLAKALEQVPELQAMADADPVYAKLLHIAQTIEGLARHASTHAAGVVIAPGKLIDYVPLYRSVKGEVTTQFDMKSIEKVGLLKMDFLGLKTLTIIEDTLQLIRASGREAPDLGALPLDDVPTFELLKRADTTGVFQVESSGMRDLLRRLQPDTFEDIIAINALFRPGPLQTGMVEDFIHVKHGRKKAKYEHEILKPILEETYGVILYQEQVMAIAKQMAGFSLGQADNLRRAMGKKDAGEMAKHKSAFVAGAVARGIKDKIADHTFDLMAHFAGYGFNKSHSAAYAVLTYRTAHLKAHYTAEFLAANMTTELGDTDRLGVLVEECRRRGITVLGPSVNDSRDTFHVDHGAIRYGLAAVKMVGAGAVQKMVEGRGAKGPFTSLHDLCERIDSRTVNKRVVEHLILGGAFDCLGYSRAGVHAKLDDAFDAAQRVQRQAALNQESLFGAPAAHASFVRYEGAEWEITDKLAREKQALGFYLSDHPLSAYRDAIRQAGGQDTTLVADLPDGSETSLVGMVSAMRQLTDRKGQGMAFITVEDFSGTLEVLVFAEVYARCRADLASGGVLLVKGRVQVKEEERPKLIAQDIRLFAGINLNAPPPVSPGPGGANGKGAAVLAGSAALGAVAVVEGEGHGPAAGPRRLRLGCDALAAGVTVEQLRAILHRYPGDDEVVLTHIPGATATAVRLRGTRVQMCPSLLVELDRLLGEEHVHGIT